VFFFFIDSPSSTILFLCSGDSFSFILFCYCFSFLRASCIILRNHRGIVQRLPGHCEYRSGRQPSSSGSSWRRAWHQALASGAAAQVNCCFSFCISCVFLFHSAILSLSFYFLIVFLFSGVVHHTPEPPGRCRPPGHRSGINHHRPAPPGVEPGIKPWPPALLLR